jgi:site-specific DNA recombinase
MTTKDKQKLRYVLYARRSVKSNKSERDTNIASLDSQKNEVREIAKREGLNIVKEFEETESASKAGGRTEFTSMIEYIKNGKADAILCFKIDRLARNSIEEGYIKQYLQDGIIQNIRSTDRDWYPEDHVLVWAIEFGSSTQYTRDLKKHIKRGQKQALLRGFRPSIAPIGYKNSMHRRQGMQEEIQVDEHNFRILRRMFEYILSGRYTPFQVLKIASDKWGLRARETSRYPQGKKFSQTSFYNILSNPFYYGHFEYPRGSGNWIKGNYRPLITKAEYDEVQRILGRTTIRPQTNFFAYTGLMRCGVCGARITAENKTKHQKNGNEHHYKYYHCTGRIDENCNQKTIRQEKLEEQIIEFLSSIKISPKFHEWAIEELRKEYGNEKQDKTSIINNQEKSLNTIELKLSNLKELAITGAISPIEYKNDRTELEEDAEKIREYLESINDKMDNWINEAERVMTFSEKAVDVFKNGDEEKRKEILCALGTEHELLDNVLTIKTEKPLLVVREMVSLSNDDTGSLEPVEVIDKYNGNVKNDNQFTTLWRWRESNPRAKGNLIQVYMFVMFSWV